MEDSYPDGVGNGRSTPASDLRCANVYTGAILQKLGYPDYARAVRESEPSLFGDWCIAGSYKRDRAKREALIAERLGIRDVPDVSYLTGFLHDLFLDAHHSRTEEKQLVTLKRVASLRPSALSSRADNWCINHIISAVEPRNYLSDKLDSLDASLYKYWRENGKGQICLRPFVPDNGMSNYWTRALLRTLFLYVEDFSPVAPRLSPSVKKKQAFLRRLVGKLPGDLRELFSNRESIGMLGDDRLEYRTRPRGKSFSDHAVPLH